MLVNVKAPPTTTKACSPRQDHYGLHNGLPEVLIDGNIWHHIDQVPNMHDCTQVLNRLAAGKDRCQMFLNLNEV